jgi:hypothetical protein
LVNAGAREKLVSIVVLDARTSKKIKNVPAFERIGDPQEGRARVTDIELRSNGAVGWIAFNNQAPAAGWEVRRADRRGSYLLAAGPSIAPTSLALSGTRLYWTDSGKAFGDTLL